MTSEQECGDNCYLQGTKPLLIHKKLAKQVFCSGHNILNHSFHKQLANMALQMKNINRPFSFLKLWLGNNRTFFREKRHIRMHAAQVYVKAWSKLDTALQEAENRNTALISGLFLQFSPSIVIFIISSESSRYLNRQARSFISALQRLAWNSKIRNATWLCLF